MRRIGLLLVILIPGIILGSWLAWYWTPRKELNMLILDKTVVTERANEHRALFWILQHERYVPPTGSFEPGEQSIGFRPTGNGRYEITGFESLDSVELERRALTYDAAYVADAYGIYETTWYQAYPELGPSTQPRRNIYGGLHPNDIAVLRRMKQLNKLLIAEFSCMEPPTPATVRAEAESLLGIHWTGWSGRFVATLDSTGDDLPRWIVDLYRKQHDGRWPFRDVPGIVLVHLDERLLVLEYPKDLDQVAPTVATIFEHTRRFGTPTIPFSYPYWFDIVQPDQTMETVAYFLLPVREEKDSVLAAFGIPRIFPAVLEDHRTRRTYYFAGDFADYPDVNELLARFKGMRELRLRLYTVEDPTSRSEFYWRFYYPLVSSILQASGRPSR